MKKNKKKKIIKKICMGLSAIALTIVSAIGLVTSLYLNKVESPLLSNKQENGIKLSSRSVVGDNSIYVTATLVSAGGLTDPTVTWLLEWKDENIPIETYIPLEKEVSEDTLTVGLFIQDSFTNTLKLTCISNQTPTVWASLDIEFVGRDFVEIQQNTKFTFDDSINIDNVTLGDLYEKAMSVKRFEDYTTGGTLAGEFSLSRVDSINFPCSTLIDDVNYSIEYDMDGYDSSMLFKDFLIDKIVGKGEIDTLEDAIDMLSTYDLFFVSYYDVKYQGITLYEVGMQTADIKSNIDFSSLIKGVTDITLSENEIIF